MTGDCFRTSAAASRPSSTSCCGVNRFFGTLMTVCATRALADTDKASAIAATFVEAVLIAMTVLLRFQLLTGKSFRSKMRSSGCEARSYAGRSGKFTGKDLRYAVCLALQPY